MKTLIIKNLIDIDGDDITKLGEKILQGEKSHSNGAIDVAKTNEGFIVLDGHHRVFEAMNKGEKEIEVNILTKYEVFVEYGNRWELNDIIIS